MSFWSLKGVTLFLEHFFILEVRNLKLWKFVSFWMVNESQDSTLWGFWGCQLCWSWPMSRMTFCLELCTFLYCYLDCSGDSLDFWSPCHMYRIIGITINGNRRHIAILYVELSMILIFLHFESKNWSQKSFYSGIRDTFLFCLFLRS